MRFRGLSLRSPYRGMLWHRVLSSLVILPILLAALWFGDPWFSVVVGAAALLGLLEFYRLVGKGGWQPFTVFGTVWSLVFIYCIHRGGIYTSSLLSWAVILSLILLVLHSCTAQYDPEKAFLNWSWTLGGMLYVVLLLGFWIMLRRSFGWEWTLLAMLSTFAVDTTAYFVGRAWGKRPMSPRISPGKTCEGAIGGLIGGLIMTIVLAFAFGLVGKAPPWVALAVPIELGKIVLLGILIGIISQVGDLAESILKRSVGAKDAGGLIPGHGGILDRLDSLILTGVLVYSYISWMR